MMKFEPIADETASPDKLLEVSKLSLSTYSATWIGMFMYLTRLMPVVSDKSSRLSILKLDSLLD